MRQIITFIFVLACVLLPIETPLAQTDRPGERYSEFRQDSYSLEYPSGWSYTTLAGGDGTTFHTFAAAQSGRAIPYCHISTLPLNPTLAPKASKMNAAQRAEFFLNSSNDDLLFTAYSNLASAKGLKLIHTGPGVLGKATPAYVADFIFKNPEGFFYRVRSHWTFWRDVQLSLWCQVASKNEALADETFLKNLAVFQRIAAKVMVTPSK